MEDNDKEAEDFKFLDVTKKGWGTCDTFQCSVMFEKVSMTLSENAAVQIELILNQIWELVGKNKYWTNNTPVSNTWHMMVGKWKKL